MGKAFASDACVAAVRADGSALNPTPEHRINHPIVSLTRGTSDSIERNLENSPALAKLRSDAFDGSAI